jgi:hypothetical protein
MRWGLFLVLFPVVTWAGDCQLPGPPQIISQTPDALYELWTVPGSPAVFWQSGIPETGVFKAFVAAVSRQVRPDPIELLVRQRELYRQWGGSPEDVEKLGRVIEGTFGHIVPAGCLETALLNEHLSRAVSPTDPVEFRAFVLGRGDAGWSGEPESAAELEIYFTSGHAQSPPDAAPLEALMEKRLAQGWVLLIDLHNHPFFLDNLARGQDIAGTTVPSDTDLSTFSYQHQRYGLRNAWVTNGFSTIRITL